MGDFVCGWRHGLDRVPVASDDHEPLKRKILPGTAGAPYPGYLVDVGRSSEIVDSVLSHDIFNLHGPAAARELRLLDVLENNIRVHWSFCSVVKPYLENILSKKRRTGFES